MGLIVLTGASAGIGAAAAIGLAEKGHRVLAIGRSERKLARVSERMRTVCRSAHDVPAPLAADFASLAEVRRTAAYILDQPDRLTALVNNAGIQPASRRTSADGLELTFAVNHLAPFLLTCLLAERLRRDGGRVVTTASSNYASGHIDFTDLQMEHNWSSGIAYDRSKLANVLFTMTLQSRTGLPASCFHPGSITTELNRESRFYRLEKIVERFIYGPPSQGAQTLIWLATSPEGAAPNAHYYVGCAAEPLAGHATQAIADRLWEESVRLVQAS